MRLGTPFKNDATGSKYPFREDDALVSPFPVDSGSGDGLVPCDLFDFVVFDPVREGFDAFISFISASGAITITETAAGKSEDDAPEYAVYTLEPHVFDKMGRALHVSKLATARFETRYPGQLGAVVPLSIEWGDNTRIRFDSHCFTSPAKKLLAFSLNGKEIDGDVLFKAGYNADVSIPSDGDSVSFNFGAGQGEGVVPCDSGDKVSEAGMPGLAVGPDGAVRIETDGCYSVVPVAPGLLRIVGYCRSCCSCDGDYAPAIKAVETLLNRILLAYSTLQKVNEGYSGFITAAVSLLDEDSRSLNLVFTAEKTDVDLSNSRFRISFNFAAMNRIGYAINIESATIYVGDTELVSFSADKTRVIDESDTLALQFALENNGYAEVMRSLQLDTSVLRGDEAVLPDNYLLESGYAMYGFVTIIGSNTPGTLGYALAASNSVRLYVRYRLTYEDGSFDIFASERVFSFNGEQDEPESETPGQEDPQ